MGVPGSSGSSFVEGHRQYSERGNTWPARAHHWYHNVLSEDELGPEKDRCAGRR